MKNTNYIKYCSNCIIPETRPNTEIDSFKAVFLNSSQKIELPKPFYIFNTNVAFFKKYEKNSERKTYKTVCHFVAIRFTFKVKEDEGDDEIIMSIPFLRSNDPFVGSDIPGISCT